MTNPVYCSCTPVVETRFSGEHERSPSIAVIEAVAAVEGVTPTELDKLYNAINPEALDTLLTDQNDTSTCIRFAVNAWNIFVREDGAIRVCDPNLQTDPAPVFDKSLID